MFEKLANIRPVPFHATINPGLKAGIAQQQLPTVENIVFRFDAGIAQIVSINTHSGCFQKGIQHFRRIDKLAENHSIEFVFHTHKIHSQY